MEEMKRRQSLPDIKAGWYLAGDVHAVGCVHYHQEGRQQEEHEDKLDASWSGRAHCESVAENKAVWKTRARALADLNKICTRTRVGWFCPYDREKELAAALKKMDDVILNYNAEAKLTNLYSNILPIEVGASNSLAARVVWQEAKEALITLQTAMKTADVRGMRKAASAVSRLNDVMPAAHESAIKGIVRSVRTLATTLKRDAEKLDRAAKVELLSEVYAPIEVKRLQFAEALEHIDGQATTLPSRLRNAETVEDEK